MLTPCGSMKLAREAQNDLTVQTVASTMVQDNAMRSSGREVESGQASHHHGLTMVAVAAHGGCPW